MTVNENMYYVLDLKKNKFFMLSSDSNKFLEKYIIRKNDFPLENKKEQVIYRQLVNLGILKAKIQPYPEKKHIDEKVLHDSAPRVEWRIPYGTNIKRLKYFSVVYEVFTIIKVRLYLKLFGFEMLVNLIKKKYKNKKRRSKKFNLEEIAIRVTQASFYVPFQIKCLEWSITYFFVSLYYNHETRVVVGLQRFPFISHAWVEDKYNKVIFDDPNLSKSLSRVLCEPF